MCAGCSTAPEEPQVRFDEGRYQQILERQKAGLSVQDDLSDKFPKMTPDDYERLGDTYVGQGNSALALVQYGKALEGDPARTSVLYKRGVVLLRERRWSDAAGQFREVLNFDAKSSFSHEGLGYALFQLGQEDKAEESLRHAISLDAKRWQTHNYLGLVYDRQKRYAEAIVSYQTALALQPGESSVSNNLGLAYYLDGRYESAVEAFQQALRGGSDNPKVHNNLGLAYAKLARYYEALDSFKKATEESQAYNNLGVFYLDQGNASQASACFEKAMELHPRYYPAAAEHLAAAQHQLRTNFSVEDKKDGNSPPSCP
jgi:Flp pilus assembly protein TadD